MNPFPASILTQTECFPGDHSSSWESLLVDRPRYGSLHFFLQSRVPITLIRSRSSFLITFVCMTITAFVLAEICSALPLSGSIYIWAAESAGPKYGRFFGFIVAWWACTAWMTFAAGNCQVRIVCFFPCD